MATLTELKNRVLEHIGMLEAGGTASTDDGNLVGDAYDSAYQILLAQHLVTWGSGDNIPDSHFMPVRNIVAYYVAPSFGVPSNDNEYVKAIRDLAVLRAGDWSQEPIESEYF